MSLGKGFHFASLKAGEKLWKFVPQKKSAGFLKLCRFSDFHMGRIQKIWHNHLYILKSFLSCLIVPRENQRKIKNGLIGEWGENVGLPSIYQRFEFSLSRNLLESGRSEEQMSDRERKVKDWDFTFFIFLWLTDPVSSHYFTGCAGYLLGSKIILWNNLFMSG